MGDPRVTAYEERVYRKNLSQGEWVSFEVKVKETDLFIKATRNLEGLAQEATLRYRLQIEQYLIRHPHFVRSLHPLASDELAPPIVRRMIWAGQQAGVGPMAAVAGAMAEAVGEDLLGESPEVIVENGGDLFARTERGFQVGIAAGASPLSLRVGLQIPGADHGWGICTSSGTVGHSLSFGQADAVCVLSHCAPLADAAATAIGNLIHSAADLNQGLVKAQEIAGLTGIVVICGEKLGAWGEVELIEM
jgi:ApbE superfamily uncharacterized protein (UPF0280 family)